MTPTQRAGIVAEALLWIGTPYHHHGDKRGVGADCAMSLIRIYQSAGFLADVDPRPYAPDWHLHRSDENYLKCVLDHADKVDSPKPADISLFKFGRCISHGAIVIEWPMVVHAYQPEGAVALTDVSKSADLLARFAGFYRILGSE